MLVGAESVVLVRFLFSLCFELLKTLYQCHKQLHEYRCDDWCCLMSFLIKSYNHNVEMGLKVSLKKLLCVSFRSLSPSIFHGCICFEEMLDHL